MPTSKEELLRRGIQPHDIHHTQHRRAEWQNYGERGLYMVTLCIDGRQPLFGNLEGNIRAQRGTADFPHIVLSPLGRTILEEELPKIHHLYPQIELWQAAIMPDHLHLLFYIREPLPPGKHLGHIISSFKGGCSRAWWAQTAPDNTAAKATGTPAAATVPTASAAATVPTASAAAVPVASAVVPVASAAAVPVALAAAVPVALATVIRSASATVIRSASATVKHPALFEAGYHDRIIKRPGMLDTIKRYMADNPLRALMRRQLPHLMERRLHLRIGTHEYAAFGALFLLKRAEKEQVFYHRRDKKTGIPTELTEGYKRQKERQLAEARTGVVLVSPGISTGESLVIDAAITEGLPVIHLQKKPIERYWKPERRRFEACARGALLILSPWGLDEELMKTTPNGTGTPSDYARFHHLNDLAEEICNTTDVTLLNITTQQ
ncbi:MAG: hypothetical protein J5524_05100 [Bacteroidaceae bacterium]|nr:hypothetical protein [Bacteroidaceae bacterium]